MIYVVGMQTTPERAPLWSPQELAAYLDVTPTTLYRWRKNDAGPPSIRVGNRVRYPVAAVKRWLEEGGSK